MLPPMIQKLGWDSLENRRLLAQLTMFYKINQGLVGICFPPEVSPLYRKHVSRLPNEFPYNHLPTRTNVYTGGPGVRRVVLVLGRISILI